MTSYPWLYPPAEREYPWLNGGTESKKQGLNSGIRVLEDLLIQVQIQKARNSLSEFLRQGWYVLDKETPLDWSWHIQRLCDHVEAMLVDWDMATKLNPDKTRQNPDFVMRCQNLAINVPPGSLKSRILSVYAPAWMWLRRPDWSVLALSANPAVADRDADLSKILIKSDWYQNTFQPDWKIRPDKDALRLFQNTEGGERITRGLDAAVVGIRANAILVDDPNDPKKISKPILYTVEQNWKAAQSRLKDERTDLRMLIQQRVHDNDLTGILFRSKETRQFWHHLSIPMEFEGDLKCVACEVIHRESFLGRVDPRTVVGQVLHPERNPPHVLASKKAALGRLAAAGQLQQRPSPEGGAVFSIKDFPPWDTIETDRRGRKVLDRVILSVDANFKEGGTSRCCIGVLGVKGSRIFIMDAWMKSVSYPDMKKKLADVIERVGKYTAILIEDKANGSALIAEFTDTFHSVIAIQPEGGKIVRASAMAPTVEAHNIYLPRNAPWLDDATAELEGFPRAQFDDFVDMLSQAVTWIKKGSAIDEMVRAFRN